MALDDRFIPCPPTPDQLRALWQYAGTALAQFPRLELTDAVQPLEAQVLVAREVSPAALAEAALWRACCTALANYWKHAGGTFVAHPAAVSAAAAAVPVADLCRATVTAPEVFGAPRLAPFHPVWQAALTTWLTKLGANPAVAQSLAERWPAHFAACLWGELTDTDVCREYYPLCHAGPAHWQAPPGGSLELAYAAAGNPWLGFGGTLGDAPNLDRLFVPRTALLRSPAGDQPVELLPELQEWTRQSDFRATVRVLTGPPGSGKSALAAWLLAHPPEGCRCLYHEVPPAELELPILSALWTEATLGSMPGAPLLLLLDLGDRAPDALRPALAALHELLGTLNHRGTWVHALILARELPPGNLATATHPAPRELRLQPLSPTARQTLWQRWHDANGTTPSGPCPEPPARGEHDPNLSPLAVILAARSRAKQPPPTLAAAADEWLADLPARFLVLPKGRFSATDIIAWLQQRACRNWQDGQCFVLDGEMVDRISPAGLLDSAWLDFAPERLPLLTPFHQAAHPLLADLLAIRHLVHQLASVGGAVPAATDTSNLKSQISNLKSNISEPPSTIGIPSAGDAVPAECVAAAIENPKSKLENPLSSWLALAAAAPLQPHLPLLFADELQRTGGARWQPILAQLLAHLIALPADARPKGLTEPLLLAGLQAILPPGQPLAVAWPSPRAAADWLAPLLADRRAYAFPYLGALTLAGQDLSGLDLTGANLVGADLTGIRGHRLKLAGADLRKANLTGADLDHADLTSANLTDATLHRAVLHQATLAGVNLRGLQLRGASLQSLNLAGADLDFAHLEEANLMGANLRDASLRNAFLEGANLRDANLSLAKLMTADLRQADLTGADLREANLKSARCTGANFTRAKTEGIYLRKADLKGTLLADHPG